MIVIPLYKINKIPSSRDTGANTGLWYDKFCFGWNRNREGKWELGSKGKIDWINTVTRGTVGSADLIDEFKKRVFSLVALHGGRAACFKTDGRFVTGIGREHPVENGFTWHHVLGVPYLPGSSVKGLVRAWADTWAEESKEITDRIFGPESGTKSEGAVIFFDAIPVGPVKLEADVMTPHYSGYYEKGGGPPADWYSPVPIPFLTVAAGQAFLFSLSPRRSEDGEDMIKASEWLEAALENIGAGAKTAVGYGRFVPVT